MKTTNRTNRSKVVGLSRGRTRFLRMESLEPRLALAAVAVPSGLVGWWTGDGNAADYSGEGNDGTLENGATYAAGRVGQAFSLDGTNDRIRVANSSVLNPAAGFTIEAWIQSKSTAGARVIVSKWNDNTGEWSYIFKDHNSSDKLRIELSEATHNDLADLAGKKSITLNNWIHVAATYDTNIVRLYFNGTQDASRTVGSGRFIDDSLADLLIGATSNGSSGASEHFSGLIDEVSIYNRALSGSEIQSIAQAGADGKIKPLVVTGSSPAAGSTIAAPITDFIVDFSTSNLGSIPASAFSVNGVAANSSAPVDSNTIQFHYDVSPVVEEGEQTMEIVAAGVAPWQRTFNYDQVAMEVIATNPAHGGILSSPSATLELTFNEAFDPDSVGLNDLVLSRGSVTGIATSGQSAIYSLAGVSEGSIAVSLPAGAVTDLFGNPVAAFSATYQADVETTAFSGALAALDPVGSLMFQGTTRGFFNSQVAPFIGSGSGGLNRSIGIAFGPDDTGDGIGELYVSSFNSDEVMRYDGADGSPLGLSGQPSDAVFITRGLGGLDNPEFMTFGPDGLLYVVSSTTDQVYRYNPVTGASLGGFLQSSTRPDHPLSAAFDADGNLYVGGAASSNVLKYNGSTGAFISTFVSTGSGGLNRPEVLTFGPDGDLYVASSVSNEILKYDGATGASLGAFVPATGGLNFPTGIVFGADGNLYVGNAATNDVMTVDGTTGSFLDTYVAPGSGGLTRPTALAFGGADGALYVSTADSSQVLRFDGTSGGPGDVDSYTLELDANQTLALRIASSVEPTVTLNHSVLGSIDLPADQDSGPGRLYQVIPLPVAGTLTIDVQAPHGLATGDYEIEATLNALLNQSTAASPVTQSLDVTKLDLSAGGDLIERAAARGSVEFNPPRITAETEGRVNDVRGSWDQSGATTNWRLNNGSGVTGSLNLKGVGNDSGDSWRFDARSGDVVTIRTHGSSSGGTLGKANVTLRGPNGFQVVGTAVTGTSSDFQIQAQALTQAGTYTILVSTTNGNKGNYILNSDITTAGDPRFLSDDIYTLSVDTPGKLSLAAATGNVLVTQPRVQFELFADGVNPLTGTPLATSAPAGALDGYLETTILAAGTYHIKVSPAGGLTGGSVNYGLAAVIGGSFDRNQANSTFATAQVLNGNGAVGALRLATNTFVPSGSGGLNASEKLLFHNGDLYVVSRNSDQIMRYDGATGAAKPAAGKSGAVFAASSLLNDPIGIAVGPDNHFYVADYPTNTVVRFDASGNSLGIFVSSGSGGLTGATGLAFGPEGNLYVCSRDNDSIMRYSSVTGVPLPSAGNSGAVFAIGGGLNGPDDVTFGPDGLLYTSSQFSNQVLRYDADGSNPQVFVGTAGGLAQPLGLRFGPNGDLYVASYGESRILRFDGQTGDFREVVAGSLSILREPTGIAFGGPGNELYFTSRGTSSVLRASVSPDYYQVTVALGETLTVTNSTPGSGPGAFSNDLIPLLELFDSAQTPLDSGSQLIISTPGTYFVRVSPGNSTSGEYVLHLARSSSASQSAAASSSGSAAGELLNPAEFDAALDLLLLEGGSETGLRKR